MLPGGIAADVLPAEAVARYRALLPTAQTVARLTVGRCSCDLVRPRQADPRDDERDLRRRYSRLGLPRDRIIRELERHRRGPVPAAPPAGWRAALAGFVAEHARNAGPTLYHLVFLPDSGDPVGVDTARQTVAEVRADPDGWLDEGRPVLVVR
jgi:hypothetical protein